MKWIKFTLETTAEAVDLVGNMLNDLGITGIEIKDSAPITEEEKKQMFIDILPEPAADDKTAQVSFYVASGKDTDTLISQVKAGLKELSAYIEVGSGKITAAEVDDEDWINNWKKYFKPFRIDDTIIIKPTWEDLTDCREEDLVIEIDPGSSFGTGSHETTKLCIIALKRYMKPSFAVLDVGSGSGILSITAKKLGAGEVLGIDIDPNAAASATENASVNRLIIKNGSLRFVTGNIMEEDGIRTRLGNKKYDVAVANILADVIIPLSAVIAEKLKPGGIFISSGIINTKEEEVKKAIAENHFTILDINRMNDWTSFVAEKQE